MFNSLGRDYILPQSHDWNWQSKHGFVTNCQRRTRYHILGWGIAVNTLSIHDDKFHLNLGSWRWPRGDDLKKINAGGILWWYQRDKRLSLSLIINFNIIRIGWIIALLLAQGSLYNSWIDSQDNFIYVTVTNGKFEGSEGEGGGRSMVGRGGTVRHCKIADNPLYR